MVQYELNLRDYIRIFRKRRTVIILTFLAVLVSSVFFSKKHISNFEAVTTVKIEEHKTVAGLLTEWIVFQPGNMMESETKIIKGYPVMRAAALRIGIINYNDPEDDINIAVSKLQKKINTEQLGNTNIIRIIATTDNSQESIEVANSVAEIYKEYNLSERRRQARGARQFVEEQLTSLETRLKEKEGSLRKLLESSAAGSLGEPIQAKLTELDVELKQLLQKYTEKHPRVIQLIEQINSLKQRSKEFSVQDMNYSRLRREVESDKKLYTMLKEKLEEARINESQKVGAVSIVDPAVTAHQTSVGPNKLVKILIGGLLGIILGFAFSLIMENLDTSIATIEDVERIANVPVLGVVPSVLIDSEVGVKKSFLENFKNRFGSHPDEDIEEKFVRLIVHFNPTSPISEAFRNIHTNLKLNEKKRKTILITSAGPREGKSTMVSNLALAVAQAGLKVLIISSDIRRPVIGKAFGVSREPGLTDVLLGMVSLKDALKNVTDLMLGEMSLDDIQQTPGLDNVWLLTSGKLQFNPAKLLESKELHDATILMKEQFDVIFFDSPPVLPVTDASLLASKMDSVVIIYEIGRTSREALLRAKNQLESVGANIAGIILNQTRQEIEAAVIHPYYYKYKYYEDETSKEKRKREKAMKV